MTSGTRWREVKGFHGSRVDDRLKVPAIPMVTAVMMGWPSASTARK